MPTTTAFGRRTHDYDFSITAIAEPDKPVILPENVLINTKLRGISTQGGSSARQRGSLSPAPRGTARC